MNTLISNPKFNKDLYRAQYFEYFYALGLDPTNKRQMEYVSALYDQVMHSLDDNLIRKLVNAFSDETFQKNTILILTSEHGEEFGEHDIFGHTSLYNSNLRVPLVLHIPNTKPMSISSPVQSVDIMPTLLELVGIQHSFTFDGLSLVPLLKGKQLPTRMIVADNYLTTQITKSIQYGDWKVFAKSDTTLLPYMIFNIAADPNEKNDVFETNIQIANKLINDFRNHQSLRMRSF